MADLTRLKTSNSHMVEQFTNQVDLWSANTHSCPWTRQMASSSSVTDKSYNLKGQRVATAQKPAKSRQHLRHRCLAAAPKGARYCLDTSHRQLSRVLPRCLGFSWSAARLWGKVWRGQHVRRGDRRPQRGERETLLLPLEGPTRPELANTNPHHGWISHIFLLPRGWRASSLTRGLCSSAGSWFP